MLAYGLGARTVEGEGNACNLFSLTGDALNPIVHNEEELVDSYAKGIKSVKLALPIFFKDLSKLCCDIAENEFHNATDVRQIKNYYVLTILMAGVIDDV